MEKTVADRHPGNLSDFFRRAAAFEWKLCRFSPVSGFAPGQPDSRCAPNTSESFGESRFVQPPRLATISFPGAKNAAKRRKNCDEFLVSDPRAGEHKREFRLVVVFDNVPSKIPILRLTAEKVVLNIAT